MIFRKAVPGRHITILFNCSKCFAGQETCIYWLDLSLLSEDLNQLGGKLIEQLNRKHADNHHLI